ncbi:hypothetical protein J132_02458 [Termitomyces sp. J132]|nr:hypothetical protein J132_02458 [Termitomyces sp. J132]
MTTDELYKLSLQHTPSPEFYNPHTRANKPYPPMPAPRIKGKKREQPPGPPNPEHPVQSKAFLKKIINTSSKVFKTNKKGKRIPVEDTRDGPVTQPVWVWKLVSVVDPASIKRHPKPTPQLIKPFGAEVGVGKDFSHLNKRRQTLRWRKVSPLQTSSTYSKQLQASSPTSPTPFSSPTSRIKQYPSIPSPCPSSQRSASPTEFATPSSPPPTETFLGNPEIRQFTTAPPLLPNWLTFKPDKNVVSSYTSHGCTASDAAIEHEQSLRAADQYSLRTRPYALGAGLHPQPSKENLSPSKDRQNRYATEEDPIQSNSWVVVNGRSDDQKPSPPTQETTATVLPQSAARPSQSSLRRIISPYTGRPLAIPTPPQHPAPVPMPAHEVHETQPPPRPSAGVPLPSKLFAWRGEQRTLSSSNQWNRMPKGSKSVDNLHALNNNLAIQRPPPLPMSRPTDHMTLELLHDPCLCEDLYMVVLVNWGERSRPLVAHLTICLVAKIHTRVPNLRREIL